MRTASTSTDATNRAGRWQLLLLLTSATAALLQTFSLLKGAEEVFVANYLNSELTRASAGYSEVGYLTALGVAVGALVILSSGWVATRFGFLAALVGAFLRFLLMFSPLTFDVGAWYAGRALPAAIVLVGVLLFGLVTALAGQALFRDPLDESVRSPR